MTSHPLDAYLFDRGPHYLQGQMAVWLAASPRFVAFVDQYKDKIRKKIRVVNGEEMALDLQAELETAYLLLAEKRFEISYEPYTDRKKRGPDFAVTWRVNLTFNLEVTRLHNSSGETEDRLADLVCEKLGQMLPAMINLLVVVGSGQHPAPDPATAMQRLKVAAEKRDPILYARQGYRSPADFFKGYERLSGLLWRPGEDGLAVLWNNPQARQPLPARLQAPLVANLSK